MAATAATTGIPHYTPKVGTLTVVYQLLGTGAERISFYKSFAAAEGGTPIATADALKITWDGEPDAMVYAKVLEAHTVLQNDIRGKRRPLPDFVTHTRSHLGELTAVSS